MPDINPTCLAGDSRPRPGTRALWRRWARQVLDLIYPPVCPGCDHELLDEDVTGARLPLCQGCEAALEPLVEPFCQICGQPFESGNEDGFRCSNCSSRKFDFEFAIAPYLARGTLRDLIHRFKFGKVAPLRRTLGQLMARVFADPRLAGHDWLMVPVPIHRRRQRQRSFNQAAELADILGEITGFPVVQALRRTVFTPPQSRLNRQQRLENLTAAIAPIPSRVAAIQNRDLLLVDDIFTTGSTGQACASVLKTAGARKVVVITLARG